MPLGVHSLQVLEGSRRGLYDETSITSTSSGVAVDSISVSRLDSLRRSPSGPVRIKAVVADKLQTFFRDMLRDQSNKLFSIHDQKIPLILAMGHFGFVNDHAGIFPVSQL